MSIMYFFLGVVVAARGPWRVCAPRVPAVPASAVTVAPSVDVPDGLTRTKYSSGIITRRAIQPSAGFVTFTLAVAPVIASIETKPFHNSLRVPSRRRE